jgi:CheY-like chemotaxis protein/HPt (histidine-containing phosphotransfer) domain-containing protein
LVEDNEINRRIGADIVRMIGCQVETAENGIEALDALQKSRFDLVVMDCQMPVMDGFQATREIRSGAAGAGVSGIPIIAMTAHAMDEDRNACIRAGMNDHLSKPFTIDAIRSIITKWLRSSFCRDSGTGASPVPLSDLCNFDEGVANVASDRREFNPGFLIRIMDNSTESANAILAIFLEDGPKGMAKLTRAMEEHDWLRVSSEAHSMKGVCLNIGVEQLARSSKRLETAAEHADERAATEEFKQFKTGFLRVLAEVRKYLESE